MSELDPTDADLITAIQRGDPSAFDQLYARHRQWVYRLAYRFTGHDADAWDVLQEAFLYLAKRLPALHLTASLRTLLFPAVKNLAIKANAKRRKLIAGDALLGALPSSPAAAGNEDLLQALQALEPQQRQLIVLRYIDDLSIAEIADILSLPEGTVKSRLFHAHRAIRDNKTLQRYFAP